MLRPAARLADDGDDVLERLADLGDEVQAFELLVGVPADLSGDEDHAALGGDAVRVALWHASSCAGEETRGPRSGVLIRAAPAPATPRPASRKRWTFPVCVFGNASMNFTERGYLYGAMVALT